MFLHHGMLIKARELDTTTFFFPCQIMRSHLDIANSIHNMSELAKAYQNGRFPLETNDSILGVTLSQFGTTLEEISSWHQIQAQQLQVSIRLCVGRDTRQQRMVFVNSL